jgi:hypothetical protein
VNILIFSSGNLGQAPGFFASGPGAIRNAEGMKQYDRWQRKPRSTPHGNRADCWTKRDQDVLAVSGVDVENVGE